MTTTAGLFEKSQPDPGTKRLVLAGEVVGKTLSNGAHAWLGIPYALPPVEERRWRAPQAVASWSGMFEALQFGSPCCQRKFFSDGGSPHFGTEDCLYLNVWAPAQRFPAIRALPVMVWIHGGGNVGCHSGTFDCSVLAQTQAVLVVSINYRVGVMGWFRHRSLRTAESTLAEQSGNFAVLDLVAALQWVQDNIAAFGGDPMRVTIFGESSGASNVYTLLVTPTAAGLFSRAIIQSGSPATMAAEAGEGYIDDPTPGNAQSSGEVLIQLLIQDDLATDRVGAKAYLDTMPSADLAAYLRGKSFADFDRAYRRITKSLGAFPQLFRDGTVLPAEGIQSALERARCHAVPVLLGTTRDEFTLLPPFMSSSSFARSKAGTNMVDIPDRALYHLAIEYLSKFFKVCCVDEPAKALKANDLPVFVYRFDWDRLIPLNWADNVSLGATHGLDVPFIFGHRRLGPEFFQIPLIEAGCEQEFTELSSRMMSYWAAFAADGRPAHGRNNDLPLWPDFQSEDIMVFVAQRDLYCRLEHGSLTKAGVLRQIAEDLRLGSRDQRCQFMAELVEIVGKFSLLTDEDYHSFQALLRPKA